MAEFDSTATKEFDSSVDSTVNSTVNIGVTMKTHRFSLNLVAYVETDDE